MFRSSSLAMPQSDGSLISASVSSSPLKENLDCSNAFINSLPWRVFSGLIFLNAAVPIHSSRKTRNS